MRGKRQCWKLKIGECIQFNPGIGERLKFNPVVMWIEFYSVKDVERFLLILIRGLGTGFSMPLKEMTGSATGYWASLEIA
jgi:hypothetical protein